MTVSITVNEERYTFDNKMTIDVLLESFDMDRSKIAVELNLKIVPKSEYTSTALNDGDQLEIVHFVGGG
ncbi:MAG: sulfur carrier protein ThiS [Rickettsiales bacterium]|nr:sulfur carrier protein ThiS [Rickettsiales bacterium]